MVVGIAGVLALSTSAQAAYPAGYSVTGIDVSHYQNTITWSSVPSSLKFVYMKATEGSDLIDSTYATNRAGARGRGFFTGAYHFAHPSSAAGSGKAQADFFYSKAPFVNDNMTLPMMLDVEWPKTGAACYGLSPSQMVTWIHDFVNEIKVKSGRTAIIYTNTNWWNPCTASSTAFSANPLAIANYTGTPNPLPAGWTTFAFWQFTDSGSTSGIIGPVDQDVFKGSISALTALVSGTAWPVPTVWCQYKVINGPASERSGPNAAFPAKAGLATGALVTAGQDGTVSGFRRLADTKAVDGHGGFVPSTNLSKTSTPCFS
jgi:GH25 family lysozyme M1 (1,4-beta-N-acetylmuramidase)